MLGARGTAAAVKDGFFTSVVGGFLGVMAVALFASFVP